MGARVSSGAPSGARVVLVLTLGALLAAAAAAAAPVPGAADFTLKDNVLEFLASGKANLASGRLGDAEVDLDNVLAIVPGHAEARRLLVEVYVRQGRKVLARGALAAAQAEGAFSTQDGEELAKRIEALADRPEGSASGALTTGAAAALAASLAGSSPATGPATSAIASAPTTVAQPAVAPATVAATVGTPEERFEQALALKRQGRAGEAIALYVTAIQENPGLLARDDGGLLETSRRAYRARLKEEPDNPNVHFVVAHLHEIFSEYQQAQDQYKEVARLAPAGSRLKGAAESRIGVLEGSLENQRRQQAEAQAKAEDEALQQRLGAIRRGESADVKGAEAFFARGRERYADWSTKKSRSLLDEAEAWLTGAVAQKGDDPEYRYTLALVLVELAALGDADARDRARLSLEKGLEQNPSGDVKQRISNLLQSIGPSGSTSAPAGEPTTEPRYKPREDR